MDLIVIGNHARSGFGRFFKTYTENLSHLTHCDLLAVRVSEADM